LTLHLAAPVQAFIRAPWRSPREPKRVLVIVDTPRWAHDFKATNLQRNVSRDYEIKKRYHAEITTADLDDADLILAFYWQQVNGLAPAVLDVLEQHLDKLLIGITSHCELEQSTRDTGLLLLDSLARAIFVVSKQLERDYGPLLSRPVFYTPNGVDTDFFRPAPAVPHAGPLRVGWAGSLANHGPAERGFYDLIVPAVQAVPGVELVTAIREDCWRTPYEMRTFYRSLDVYVCGSRSEGTPNPCLEAAACGVTLVATRVGVLPELIQHGVNGLLVRRDVSDMSAKLMQLRDSPGLRQRLSHEMQRSIGSWSWRVLAKNYEKMFRSVIG
jgi:glycosyltransferase involved in cell wall biosynthesis